MHTQPDQQKGNSRMKSPFNPAALAALMTASAAGYAAETPHVAFEWILPDKRVDGRALAPAEIDRIELRCVVPQSSGEPVLYATSGAVTTLAVPSGEFFSAGASQQCQARVVDTLAQASQWSDPVAVDQLSAPAGPSLFRVTIQLK